MATNKAASVAITAAAAVNVACPTDPDDEVVVINYGANPVWIQHGPAPASATAGGDNCEIVLSLGSTYLMWHPAPFVYSMRAQTGDSSINIVNRQGR